MYSLNHCHRYTGAVRCGLLLSLFLSALIAYPQPIGVTQAHYLTHAGETCVAQRALRISPDRYVSFAEIYMPNRVATQPLFWLTDGQGNTLGSVIYPYRPDGWYLSTSGAAAGKGRFYVIGVEGGVMTLNNQLALLDSTAAVVWLRSYDGNGQGGSSDNGQVLALPNGPLVLQVRRNSVSSEGVIRRFTARGQERWQRTLYHLSSLFETLTPLPDGAYVAGAVDPALVPGGSPSLWSYDIRLTKITARGDTLGSVWVRHPRSYEWLRAVRATTDGGLVLVGGLSVQPFSTPRQAMLIKLNAQWQEEWRWTAQPPSGSFDTGGEVLGVEELANGHFLIWGNTSWSGLREIAPPVPGGTVGQSLWDWYSQGTGPIITSTPRAFIQEQGDTQAIVMGDAVPRPGTGTQSSIYQTHWLGLPLLAPSPLCNTPPATPAASHLLQPLNTVRFTVDSAATSPGGQYAEIDLVTWNYGDGSPLDSGWVQSHQYTTTDPVRVRVCVTNNLWCQTCTELFPFGPVGVREELTALVGIYPNPSATGAFTLRLREGAPVGATYTVLDATGRTIASGTAASPETALDLRAQATGVYALRLTWPDGRSLTRRLVRQ